MGTTWLLRAEGLALFIAATLFYFHLPAPASWWIFLIFFLAPDLSMLGYLAGPKAGAAAYNAVHTTIGPILLAMAAWATGLPFALDAAAIWLAHIGIDRALGYGLKHRTGFKHTHLE
ncbi:DUF4260 domain-containing protein [Notoacmeibacter ruber]|nr:DUF4260 domain-containing protein [Notoacmeibacter ruber]